AELRLRLRRRSCHRVSRTAPLVLLLPPFASRGGPRLPRVLRHRLSKRRVPRKRVSDREPDPALAPGSHGLLVEQSLFPLREGPLQLPSDSPSDPVVAFPRLHSSHAQPAPALPGVGGLRDRR